MHKLDVLIIVVALLGSAKLTAAQQINSLNDHPAALSPATLRTNIADSAVVVPLAPTESASQVAMPSFSELSELRLEQLRQKLALRDRLQREIAELRLETNTPEQILVRVRILEVNRSKLRSSGVDVDVIDVDLSRPVSVTKFLTGEGRPRQVSGPANLEANCLTMNSLTLKSPVLTGIFDRLEQDGFVCTLAEPSLTVLDGRPAQLRIGGEYPVPPAYQGGANASKDYGTQLDVTATSLGNNHVRLALHPRVTEIDESRGIVVNGETVPAVRVREVEFSGNLEFGRSIVVAGLEQERRTKKSSWGFRQQDELEQTALVIVATPELVR